MNTTTKSRLISFAKLAAAIAIVFSIAKATQAYRQELSEIGNMNLGMLAVALFLCITYRVANAHGWSFVLKALGQNISAATSLRIWITSEACRWLPGSVWSYGSRAVQAKKHGASPLAAGSSLLLELLLTIAAWTLTAIVGLVAYRSVFSEFIQKLPLRPISIGLVACVSLTVVVFFGSQTGSEKFNRRARGLVEKFKALGTLKICKRHTCFAAGYYFVMCLFNGFICSFVIGAVAPDSNVPMLAVIGINAFAWLIGFFAFLAPGGLVVREGALAALLAAWLPAEQALTFAIAWRMIQIAAEVACMAATWAVATYATHRPARNSRLPA